MRYAKLAETLGYERVWLFDSPALYGDLWMAVGRVAEATAIGLGAGVAVPSLRHPMVTASAIATVEDLAPGRLITAFGTGFTARKAMGQPAMKWADVTVLPDRDRAAVRAAGAAILQSGWTGDATSVATHFAQAGGAGIGEIVYTAAGPDIPSELEAFAEAVR